MLEGPHDREKRVFLELLINTTMPSRYRKPRSGHTQSGVSSASSIALGVALPQFCDSGLSLV